MIAKDCATHIKAVFTVALLLFLVTGCGMAGPYEEYRQEGNATVYRSADHTPPDTDLTSSAMPKKVPGE